tara:strand:- start:6501 stop:8741 length:2241 start_codon:yes stop_codon:yes gene_type:complete
VTPNNLGAFAPGEVLYRVFTRAADAEQVRAVHEGVLPEGVTLDVVEVREIDELPPYDAVIASHRQAIQAAVEEGAALVVLTPDAIWTDGSFSSARRHALAGKRALVMCSVRVSSPEFLPLYRAMLDAGTPNPRDVVGLALRNLHPISEALFWKRRGFSNHPSHLYWRVGEGELLARCFHMHPLMINPARVEAALAGSIDEDFVSQACLGMEDVHVITDSDEGAAFDLADPGQPTGTEDAPRRGANPFRVALWAQLHADPFHREYVRRHVRLHAGPVDPARWAAAERASDQVVGKIERLVDSPLLYRLQRFDLVLGDALGLSRWHLRNLPHLVKNLGEMGMFHAVVETKRLLRVLPEGFDEEIARARELERLNRLAEEGGRPRAFHAVTAVWGRAAIDRYRDFVLPTLLTAGNLLALDPERSVYRVFTQASDARELRELHAKVLTHMPVDVVVVNAIEGREDQADLLACHRMAVRRAALNGAALVLLPCDAVWSEGSLKTALERVEGGARAVLCAPLVVEAEPFCQALGERSPRAALSGRELVALGLRHLHRTSLVRFWDQGRSTHPSQLCWRVGESGVLVHSFHLHPLLVFPRRSVEFRVSVASDFLAATIPRDRSVHVVLDSDEAALFELKGREWRAGEERGLGRFDALSVARWALRHTHRRQRGLLRFAVRIHAEELSPQWEEVEARADRVVKAILRSIPLARPTRVTPLVRRGLARVLGAWNSEVHAAKDRFGSGSSADRGTS